MVHTFVPEIPRAKTYIALPAAQQDGDINQMGAPAPAIPFKVASVLTPNVPAPITANIPGLYQFSGKISMLPGSSIREISMVARRNNGTIVPLQAANLIADDHFVFMFQAYLQAGDQFLIMLSNPKLVKAPTTDNLLEFFPNNMAQPVNITGFTDLIQVRFLGSQ